MANGYKLDRRIIKTERSAYASMTLLLQNTNFAKITVRNICEAAQISRAAFYAHFNDKYDLLKKWLIDFFPKQMGKYETFERVEARYRQFLFDGRVLLKNILANADHETIEAVSAAIAHIAGIPPTSSKADAEHVVYYSFYVGGITHYLLWLVNRNFPSDIPPMNPSLFEMMTRLRSMKFVTGRE